MYMDEWLSGLRCFDRKATFKIPKWKGEDNKKKAMLGSISPCIVHQVVNRIYWSNIGAGNERTAFCCRGLNNCEYNVSFCKSLFCSSPYLRNMCHVMHIGSCAWANAQSLSECRLSRQIWETWVSILQSSALLWLLSMLMKLLFQKGILAMRLWCLLSALIWRPLRKEDIHSKSIVCWVRFVCFSRTAKKGFSKFWQSTLSLKSMRSKVVFAAGPRTVHMAR